MAWFNSLDIKKRMLAGFAIVVIAFTSLAGFQLYELGNVKSSADGLYERNLVKTEQVHSINEDFLAINRAVLRAVSADDDEGRQTQRDEMTRLDGDMKAHIATYESLILEEEQPMLDAFTAAYGEALPAWNEQIQFAAEGDMDALNDVRTNKVNPATTKATEEIQQMLENNSQRAETRYEEIGHDYSTARVTTVALVLVAIGLAMAIALFISGSVNRVVRKSADELSTASEQLAATSEQLGANSHETATQAEVVSGVAQQVSHNVTTVAAAMEEMSASITEISQSSASASQVAFEATETVASTNANVQRLGEASQEIGKVIEVITSIAEQTNMLALNATIEAARAGEAGKGFAVVANEVKELAQATASATNEIGGRIAAIQGETKQSVELMAQISDVIDRIQQLQNGIASAVEEQTATTAEISRSINEAASGSAEIAENISSVADAANDTATGAANSKTVALGMAEIAQTLQVIVGIRTASTTPVAPAARAVQPRRTLPAGPKDVVTASSFDPYADLERMN